MTTSNVFSCSLLKLSRLPTTIRCPVLDTGKNSVKPSTTPRISALQISIQSIRGPCRRGCSNRATLEARDPTVARPSFFDDLHAYAVCKDGDCTGFVVHARKLQLLGLKRVDRVVGQKLRREQAGGRVDLLRVGLRFAADRDVIDARLPEDHGARSGVVGQLAGQREYAVHGLRHERAREPRIESNRHAVAIR